jgi:hypothetical protein
MQLIFSCLMTQSFQSPSLSFWVTMYFDLSCRYLSLNVTRHVQKCTTGHVILWVQPRRQLPRRWSNTRAKSAVLSYTDKTPAHWGKLCSDLYWKDARELEDLLQSFRRWLLLASATLYGPWPPLRQMPILLQHLPPVSPQRLDQLWGPPSFLPTGYRG